MANPKNPEYTRYEKELGKNPGKQFLGSSDYIKRDTQKEADIGATTLWLKEEFSIQTYLQVSQDELALFEHYNSMEEVDVDPDIKQFWQSQNNELTRLDTKGLQEEYLSAYKSWLGELERMDEKKREELSTDKDFDYMELQAQEGIQKANESVADAKRGLKNLRDDTNPFTVLLGVFTGANKDSQKFREAFRRYRDANRGVRDAERRLTSVRERRKEFEERKDKIDARQAAALDKMLTAREHMEANIASAQQIHKDVELPVQKNLHAQYDLIDKYIAIQNFKKNLTVSQRTSIQNSNSELLKQLDAFPESAPSKTFKVTKTGPLQILATNTKTVEEIDSQIDDVKGKITYADDLDMDHLNTELNQATIHLPEDTITKLETAMNEIPDAEKEGKRYKQLEAKRDHLKLQKRVETAKEEIEVLKNEVRNCSDETLLQEKLQALQAKQGQLKIFEEDLQKDSYSQNIANLQELQKLVAEKTKSQSLSNLEDLTQQIEQSRIPVLSGENTVSVSMLFASWIKTIRQQRDALMVGYKTTSERDDAEGR